MRITQHLRKPSNWQDFEKLCLLLWRAEWGDEVKKAKEFNPRLKHLVVATTAEKDAEIEEYVRTLDESLRAEGWFSLDIKSWEDIVLLLELHKEVLNHYLDITTEQYEVSVKFVGDTEYIESEVVFFRTSDAVGLKRGISSIREEYKYRYLPIGPSKSATEINLSYVKIPIILKNLGRSPLDDYKMKFRFDEEVALATKVETHYSTTNPVCDVGYIGFDLAIDKGVVEYSSRFSLVSNDSDEIPVFYAKPHPGTKNLTLHWELLSRYYHTTGILNIHLKETIHDLDGQAKDIPPEEREIVDYIIFRDEDGTCFLPKQLS